MAADPGKKAGHQRCLRNYYFKFEDAKQRYQTIYHETDFLPMIDLDTPTGQCPFVTTLQEFQDRKTKRAADKGKIDTSNGSRESKKKPSVVKRTYCEICNEHFKLTAKHVQSAKHREFVENDLNYREIDDQISSMKSLSDFEKWVKEEAAKQSAEEESKPETPPEVTTVPQSYEELKLEDKDYLYKCDVEDQSTISYKNTELKMAPDMLKYAKWLKNPASDPPMVGCNTSFGPESASESSQGTDENSVNVNRGCFEVGDSDDVGENVVVDHMFNREAREIKCNSEGDNDAAGCEDDFDIKTVNGLEKASPDQDYCKSSGSVEAGNKPSENVFARFEASVFCESLSINPNLANSIACSAGQLSPFSDVCRLPSPLEQEIIGSEEIKGTLVTDTSTESLRKSQEFVIAAKSSISSPCDDVGKTSKQQPEITDSSSLLVSASLNNVSKIATPEKRHEIIDLISPFHKTESVEVSEEHLMDKSARKRIRSHSCSSPDIMKPLAQKRKLDNQFESNAIESLDDMYAVSPDVTVSLKKLRLKSPAIDRSSNRNCFSFSEELSPEVVTFRQPRNSGETEDAWTNQSPNLFVSFFPSKTVFDDRTSRLAGDDSSQKTYVAAETQNATTPVATRINTECPSSVVTFSLKSLEIDAPDALNVSTQSITVLSSDSEDDPCTINPCSTPGGFTPTVTMTPGVLTPTLTSAPGMFTPTITFPKTSQLSSVKFAQLGDVDKNPNNNIFDSLSSQSLLPSERSSYVSAISAMPARPSPSAFNISSQGTSSCSTPSIDSDTPNSQQLSMTPKSNKKRPPATPTSVRLDKYLTESPVFGRTTRNVEESPIVPERFIKKDRTVTAIFKRLKRAAFLSAVEDFSRSMELILGKQCIQHLPSGKYPSFVSRSDNSSLPSDLLLNIVGATIAKMNSVAHFKSGNFDISPRVFIPALTQVDSQSVDAQQLLTPFSPIKKPSSTPGSTTKASKSFRRGKLDFSSSKNVETSEYTDSSSESQIRPDTTPSSKKSRASTSSSGSKNVIPRTPHGRMGVKSRRRSIVPDLPPALEESGSWEPAEGEWTGATAWFLWPKGTGTGIWTDTDKYWHCTFSGETENHVDVNYSGRWKSPSDETQQGFNRDAKNTYTSYEKKLVQLWKCHFNQPD